MTRRAGPKARQTASRGVRRPLFHGLVLAIALITAFYATFLPSRASTRAHGFTNSVDGLTYPSVAASPALRQEVLPVSVSRQTGPSLAANGVYASPASLTQTNSAGLAAPAPALEPRLTATGAPPSPAAQAAAPPCDTSISILYCVYTIQAGDTLSEIAGNFGLKTTADAASWELLVHSNKPDIVTEDDVLQIGQKIRVPTRQAVLHTVHKGESLSSIADTYDVTMADIVAVDINSVADINALKVGDEILIPSPKRFAKPIVVASSGSSGAQIVRGGQASRSGFIWPVTGPISSYFGPAHPLGIDVDLYATPNAPIAAAAAGTVIFAGGNVCCSYGLYVVVDHGNGFETLYAHLSSISVRTGQSVAQGQLVGYAGRTGYATGNHLHFEVHVGGRVDNPLLYLP